MNTVVLFIGVFGLLVAIFVSPLLIRKLWELLIRYVLRSPVEQGLIEPELRYRDALHLVLSVVVWTGLPVLAFLVALLIRAGPPSYFGLFVIPFYSIPLMLAYFVLGGALWLQWVWRWAARVLFPGAVELGWVPERLPYKAAALLMLVLLGLSLLWALPRAILGMR
jgi:hypothetical protein